MQYNMFMTVYTYDIIYLQLYMICYDNMTPLAHIYLFYCILDSNIYSLKQVCDIQFIEK